MTQASADPPCSTVAFRIISRKEWFDPDDAKRVKSEAFMRRAPRLGKDGLLDPMDQDGLSLQDSSRMTMKDCEDCGINSGYGISSLHVGTLRDLGLTVARDPRDDRKLLITDIPFENPNDADQEALLDAVAVSARIASRERWKRKTTQEKAAPEPFTRF
jgi:hypothetical protein